MNRFQTPWMFALLAAACGCSSEGPGSGHGPTTNPEPPGPSAIGRGEPTTPNDHCVSQQLPALQSISGRDTLVTPHGVFVSRDRGLWRSTGTGEPLRRLSSFPRKSGALSMALVGDSIFAVAEPECEDDACVPATLLRSDDGGETWIDTAPVMPSELDQPLSRLWTNGNRFLAVDSTGHIAEADLEGQTWTLLSAEAPEDDNPHFVVEIIGFDEDALVANDLYGAGVVRLPPGAARWERLVGLGEWGYSSFATRGERKVTSNPGAIFTLVDGVWNKTLEIDSSGFEIVDLGDTFLAFDEHRRFTSSDGLAWGMEFEADAPHVWQTRLSRHGSTLAWLGPGLMVSDDDAQTWTEVTTPVDDVMRVAAVKGAVYARRMTNDGPAFAGNWFVSEGESFSPAPWTNAGAATVAFDGDGAYACDATSCAYHPSGESEPSRMIDISGTLLERAFATPSGLFLASSLIWDEGCYSSVREGLLRVDPGDGTTVAANAGLPYGEYVAGCRWYWQVQNLVEVDGTLFVALYDDFDIAYPAPTHTYRSDDGGLTWTLVSEDLLLAAAHDERGIVALFAEQGLARSTDGGASFVAIGGPDTGDAVTDVVTVDGAVVVSTASWEGASVWASRDDAEWSPLAPVDASSPSFGPVRDLDTRDGRLWAATTLAGVWEFEASGLRGCYPQ